MKKTVGLVLSVLFATLSVCGQSLRVAEVFRQMPDSLVPYLTTNNRLDMIDFMDANMKAEVTNLLEGKSEMTALTDDSLSIRANDALRLDLKLVERDSTVVCLKRTYQTLNGQTDVVTTFYSTDWQLIEGPFTSSSSSLLKRDEEVFLKP